MDANKKSPGQKKVIIAAVCVFILLSVAVAAYRITDAKQVDIAKYLPFAANIQEILYVNIKGDIVKDIVVSEKLKMLARMPESHSWQFFLLITPKYPGIYCMCM